MTRDLHNNVHIYIYNRKHGQTITEGATITTDDD
jgi:hypothetical protein